MNYNLLLLIEASIVGVVIAINGTSKKIIEIKW